MREEGVRVVLVDEHLLVRQGLREMIDRENGMLVHGDFESLADCVGGRAPADIVVISVGGPAGSAASAVREAVQSLSPAKVLVLGSEYDDEALISALEAGARGFIAKTDSAEELVGAVRAIATTGHYVNPNAARSLMNRLQGETKKANAMEKLSPRETQVVRLLAQGFSSKEAAVKLGLEHETIRSYRKTIMRKMGVANLAALTREAIRAGLVKPGQGPLS